MHTHSSKHVITQSQRLTQTNTSSKICAHSRTARNAVAGSLQVNVSLCECRQKKAIYFNPFFKCMQRCYCKQFSICNLLYACRDSRQCDWPQCAPAQPTSGLLSRISAACCLHLDHTTKGPCCVLAQHTSVKHSSDEVMKHCLVSHGVSVQSKDTTCLPCFQITFVTTQ